MGGKQTECNNKVGF